MLFKKRKRVLKAAYKQNVAVSRVALKDISPDFIPYACHYNENTLLTKNGELMQVIKITGSKSEFLDSRTHDLRDLIRQALKDDIKTANFSLWFHTIRRKKNISLSEQGEEGTFVRSLNELWNDVNKWESKFVNEVFITVIISPDTQKNKQRNKKISGLFYGKAKKIVSDNLEKAFLELDQVTDKMLEKIDRYGAYKLTVFMHNDSYHSEPMRFLGKIINLEERERKLLKQDLSHYLSYSKIAFAHNLIEVSNDVGGVKQKHFAAIFSIKEYTELSLNILDKFLQLPEEFIITQTLDFIHYESALAGFEYQRYILDVSNDKKFLELSGINDIIKSNRGVETDYGEHQLTLMLIADTIDDLENKIERTVEALKRIGIIAIREDMAMEQCFWSQLPANFSYIARKKAINTSRIAGCSRLSNYGIGSRNSNYWGEAVTILPTIFGTPYYFNFHDKLGNGHTLLVGPYKSGKTVLLNFLLAELTRLEPRIILFDYQRTSEALISLMGGKYSVLEDGKQNDILFNPLNTVYKDKLFLKEWLHYMLAYNEKDNNFDYPLPQEDLALLDKILDHILSLPEVNHRLSVISQLLKKAGKNHLVKNLSSWFGEGENAFIFDNDEDNFDMRHNICGFDFTNIIDNKRASLPTTLYILHRIIHLTKDRVPTVIILDEAWKMLDNPMIAPIISDLLDRLTNNNAFVIFATESISDIKHSMIRKDLIAKMSNQIYMPNDSADNSYKEIFGLSDSEYKMLEKLNIKKRQIILKNTERSIILELDFSKITKILPILSGNAKVIEAINFLKEKYNVPVIKGDLLKKLYDIIDEYIIRKK